MSRQLSMLSAATRSRPARRWNHWFRLAGCFCAVFAATVIVGLEDSGNLIWVSNGLLLSYLLLAPRWYWKHYLAAGFIAMLAGGLVASSQPLTRCAVLTLLNIGETSLAAFLLRKRSGQMPRFADPRYLLRFAAFAVLLSPAIAGLLFAITAWLWMRMSPWHPLAMWITTDGLGTAIVTPACISFLQSRLKQHHDWRRYWFLPAILVPITFFSFCQMSVPVIFLIYPWVALILFRFDLGGASVSALFVAAVGSWFTIHGYGPFAKIGSVYLVSPTVTLQLYIASGMFMVFAAASVLDTLRATERRLGEIVSLHRLVTDYSRDVIILYDFDGKRNYVSASASDWGGWKQEELREVNSLELVHPDDRARVAAVVHDLRSGKDGALLECRVRNKHGDYAWFEANLRLVRDPVTRSPVGILNMARDISRRKHAQQQLKNAYTALEALAVTDPLTHLANRRGFDQRFANEWRRCRRDHIPLSLLVLDVDWFKTYNDTYGHPRGDICLKQIAEATLDVVTRPGDLVTRIGGEEFAVILPNTSNEGAMEVGKQISAALKRRRLPHASNPTGLVTISAGCATVIPAQGMHPGVLMRQADEALYAAKHAGRNQVCSASEQAPALQAC